MIVLFILFSNRDRNQDYKLSQPYKNLSNEDRLRADLVHGLDKMIKNVNNPAEDKFNNNLLFIGALADRKTSLMNNKIDLAKQYGLTIYATTEIIEECCLGAYASHME